MDWALGGVVLWLGGWWFTGRLFPVYTKAVFLEELDHRRAGDARQRGGHLTGNALFLLFDLGLLLLGIHSAALVMADAIGMPFSQSLIDEATTWSVASSLYLLRGGAHLHGFHHDRWRARTGHHLSLEKMPGTWRGLWDQTAPAMRVLFLIGPLSALVPLAATLANERPERFFYVPSGPFGPFIAWFIVPQLLLVVALASPLARIRKLADSESLA